MVSATTLKRMGRKREFKYRGGDNSTGKEGIQVKETWVLFFQLFRIHYIFQNKRGKENLKSKI